MLLPEQGEPQQCHPVNEASVWWLLQQQVQYWCWDAHLRHLWNKMGKEGNINPGQSICHNIQHSMHVLCRKMESIVSCIEKQCAEQMVHAFRWTKWWGLCTPARRQNNCLRKILPGRMTVAACAKWPTNDSSSLRVHEHLLLHSSTNVLSRVTFSGGASIETGQCPP